jgi:hypothetical protein
MFAVRAACNRDRMEPDGISDIEGKVTRVGASECGQRASSATNEFQIEDHDLVTEEKSALWKGNKLRQSDPS